MKKYTLNILTNILIVLVTFSLAAQDKESTLDKLQANTWHMQGLSDKIVTNKYGSSQMIQYYKEDEYDFKSKYEYYLSNTIDQEFNSSKLGQATEGKYIISRNKRKKGDNRPFKISVLQIVQINKNWLILRNVKQKHLLKYRAE